MGTRWSFIVFDADSGQSLKMIEGDEGMTISFLPDSIHLRNGGPNWSPDGKKLAFTSTPVWES